MSMSAINEFKFKIRIAVTEPKYWQWASKNVPIGTWGEMLPIIGTSGTFCFKHEEDLLMFKLTFGL